MNRSLEKLYSLGKITKRKLSPNDDNWEEVISSCKNLIDQQEAEISKLVKTKFTKATTADAERVLQGTVIGIFVNEKLAGFVSFKTFIEDDDKSASISNLYVGDKFRSKGLGTVLLEDAKTELMKKGTKRIYISFVSGNNGAEKLYGSLGFIPIQSSMILVL